ncbi:MAG: 5'/3'-nucleotidase SurE [Dysgonomonas sp.]
MAKKPLILIINDDGYQAKGIVSLTEYLRGIGELVVVAPDGPRSGMSGSITSLQPIRYTQISHNREENLTIYSCTGTPVDCVKLGISEVLGRKPDLLVSGINHGSNANICVHYSGTMGAAIEGCIFKVPSIGFSLLNHSHDADFSVCKDVVRSISKKVIETGLPQGICLNVNIPKDEVKGIKVCRQTSGQWVKEFIKSKDGQNKEIFWLTGRFENDEPNNQDTDEWALENGYATVVPTTIDLTAYDMIDKLKGLEILVMNEIFSCCR